MKVDAADLCHLCRTACRMFAIFTLGTQHTNAVGLSFSCLCTRARKANMANILAPAFQLRRARVIGANAVTGYRRQRQPPHRRRRITPPGRRSHPSQGTYGTGTGAWLTRACSSSQHRASCHCQSTDRRTCKTLFAADPPLKSLVTFADQRYGVPTPRPAPHLPERISMAEPTTSPRGCPLCQYDMRHLRKLNQ